MQKGAHVKIQSLRDCSFNQPSSSGLAIRLQVMLEMLWEDHTKLVKQRSEKALECHH